MTGLAADALSVAYGGHLALSDVTLEAPLGQITGLIGPNGAGKTTMFNACNGFVRHSEGRVSLFGRDVTRLGTAARARLGLGRTFQRVEVCDTMTVRRNIAVGCEARMVGRNPVRQFFASPGERRSVVEATDRALELCGITHLAERSAGSLATGQRRVLELARVVSAGFRMLLLDEPSAGLDESETAQMGEVLTAVVASDGVGILLVEHDMSLVMEVCSDIFVLDFGKLIARGTPSEVQRSEAVRAAYLGTESVEASAS